MRAKNALWLLLIRCLLALSAALAQDDCEEATREVRVCSEARQHLSQQLSSTKSEVRNLQQSIKGLESKLKDQQHVCREASENQGKCSKNLEELNAQLQAAQEELGGSNTRISELMVDLEDARRLKSQLQDARKQCEGMAQQEREKQEQRIFDLQQQLQSSEAARQQSESDISSSVLAVREEAAKLRTELDQERTKFEAASSRIQAEHGAKIQMMQQQLEAAEADHTSAKSDAETLTVELQSCQVSLSQELQVRRQDEAQAALQESLHSKVISEFKQQEQELVKDSHEMQEEIDRLSTKLAHMGEQLRFAEQAYLPLWSIPYYDEAAKQAAATKEQAVIYYEREIKTGKAYQQTKNTVMDASSRFMTMTEPHVRKAKILLKPLIESIVAKLEYAKEAISRQLQENKYRAIVQHAQKIQDFLREFWLSMVDHVAGILDSDMVKQAREDLTRMYTLLLGANVSGSGIDPALPATMARYTLFAVPLLLVLPVLMMCCSRPRAEEQPQVPPKPRAQLATSNGGDGRRSKKR